MTHEGQFIFTVTVHPGFVLCRHLCTAFIIRLTVVPVSECGGAVIWPHPRVSEQTDPGLFIICTILFDEIHNLFIFTVVPHAGQICVILSAVSLSFMPLFLYRSLVIFNKNECFIAVWKTLKWFWLFNAQKMFMDVNSDEMITHSSTHRCSRWKGAHQYSGHRATVRPQTYKHSLHCHYSCCLVVHFSILDTVTETSGFPETISKHGCLSCAAQSKHIQCVCWQCLWCPAGHSCCWRWSDPCDSVCSISELRSTTSMCSQSDTDAENPPRNREPLTLGEKHRQFTVSKV